MAIVAVFFFVIAILYGVIGNLVVWFVLSHRKVPMRFMMSAIPFYLYGACNRLLPPSPALKRFALSTNVSFILAIPLLFWMLIVT
jgi:hypothetical protein